MRYWILIAILAALALQPASVAGAELAPDTVKGWERFITTVRENIATSSDLFWMDQSPARMQRVRSGDVAVELKPRITVPEGLIHICIGAVFIRGATIEDVLSVMRDYDRYREIYTPTVIESRSVAKNGDVDRYAMLWLNKAFFLSSAIYGEYETYYVRGDEKRWYSVGRATRLQQIDRYGQADERKLPPGEGNGFLWRLCSVSKYQERDGGVYLELEAITLSRDIPNAVRWVVQPTASHIACKSMATTLRQTRDAVLVKMRNLITERQRRDTTGGN